jgi:hypothetical protein
MNDEMIHPRQLETTFDMNQTYQFMGNFITSDAQVPMCTIRRDWPGRRILNVMEHA